MSPELLNVEVTADTLDAAVESALEQLGCTRAEADIEVLQMHSNGLLRMFGRRPARVRVRLHDRGIIARHVTRQLLSKSGLTGDVVLAPSSERIDLLLSGEDASRLIGRHGQTLDALQTLVVTMTDRLTTDRTPIFLDVEGYRERRHDFLQQLALRMARKVRRSGKPATTPPLNLNERRVLHEIFKQEPGLVSHSKNREGGRKVIVLQARG